MLEREREHAGELYVELLDREDMQRHRAGRTAHPLAARGRGGRAVDAL